MKLRFGSSCSRNYESGFNLVELMVVVSIIGILASVAVPRFATFKARAMQTEAKSVLNGIFLSMQSYQANYSTYPVRGTPVDPAAADIGYSIGGNDNNMKYNYQLVSQADGWAAAAHSIKPLANNMHDTMRINAKKRLCSPYDAVAKLPSVSVKSDARYCPGAQGNGSSTYTVAIDLTEDLESN